jgi:hypothetical protein
MSFEIELREQMIVTVAAGPQDFSRSMHRLMLTIHEAARRCREEGAPPWHYLADVRGSKAFRSTDEIWSVAQAIGTHLGTLSGRIAVVVTDAYSQELARMFGSIVQSYGMKFGLFDDIKPAEDWLQLRHPTGSDHLKNGDPVIDRRQWHVPVAVRKLPAATCRP